jgi:hypothetical protein
MTAQGTDIPTLPLTELADRHFGLTSAIAATYLEAAEVSLEQYWRRFRTLVPSGDLRDSTC